MLRKNSKQIPSAEQPAAAKLEDYSQGLVSQTAPAPRQAVTRSARKTGTLATATSKRPSMPAGNAQQSRSHGGDARTSESPATSQPPAVPKTLASDPTATPQPPTVHNTRSSDAAVAPHSRTSPNLPNPYSPATPHLLTSSDLQSSDSFATAQLSMAPNTRASERPKVSQPVANMIQQVLANDSWVQTMILVNPAFKQLLADSLTIRVAKIEDVDDMDDISLGSFVKALLILLRKDLHIQQKIRSLLNQPTHPESLDSMNSTDRQIVAEQAYEKPDDHGSNQPVTKKTQSEDSDIPNVSPNVQTANSNKLSALLPVGWKWFPKIFQDDLTRSDVAFMMTGYIRDVIAELDRENLIHTETLHRLGGLINEKDRQVDVLLGDLDARSREGAYISAFRRALLKAGGPAVTPYLKKDIADFKSS